MRAISFGTPAGDPLHIETMALHRTDPEHAVLATGGRRAVPVAIGGSGKPKRSAKSALVNYGYNSKDGFKTMCRLQGFPTVFSRIARSPWTARAASWATAYRSPWDAQSPERLSLRSLASARPRDAITFFVPRLGEKP
jgi:hypothetical protein